MASLPWLETLNSDRATEIRSISLSKLVRDDLLTRIVGGHLQPGERINEPDVARRLEVSRVPVREALRELESSGLVVSRKHAGVFVRALEAAEVRNLYEVRGALDGLAGQRAAGLPIDQRHALRDRLEHAIDQMGAAAREGALQRYYRENLQFHWDIVLAAGNAELESSYRALIHKLHLSRLRNLAQADSMRHSIAEHQAIAHALGEGDPVVARQLIESHVNDAWTRLNKEAS